VRRTSPTTGLTRTRYNDAGRTFPAARKAEQSFGVNSSMNSSVPLHEGQAEFRQGGATGCRLATTCARHVRDALPAGHGG